jgi:hypothetical protein
MEHDRNMNKHIFKTSEISNLLNNFKKIEIKTLFFETILG